MAARNQGRRWFPVGLILLALVFLISCVLIGQTSADVEMATSTLASAGGQAASTHFKMKYTLGQSSPIGSSASTNFQMGAGFWYQDPLAPSAIRDLTIQLSMNDIYLEWSHAGDNVGIDHYVVYRGSDPEFAPTSGDSISGTRSTSYLDPGAAGDTLTHYFYVVKARDPSRNLAEESNWVGEFDKNIITCE
jgi:hypothetical protein